jgi:ATP-dependent DNA ligase
MNTTTPTIIHTTATLTAKTSKGLDKKWRGHVAQDGDKFYTQTSYWQVKADGTESKMQYSAPVLIESKNVGRSNETSVRDQAFSELESEFAQQKLKNGYREDGEAAEAERFSPMLAHVYADRKHTVLWDNQGVRKFVQHKYDGMRAGYDGTTFVSRGNKDLIPECVAHLSFDTQGYTVDGEVILPHEQYYVGKPTGYGFQMTMRAVKKYRPELSPQLLYRVYDVVMDAPFEERLAVLKRLVAESSNPSVVLSETFEVSTELEVMTHQEQFLIDGWEGTMIRVSERGYKPGHRDIQLLKLKEFSDAEFLVVDIVEGKGKFEGLPIIVCRTEPSTEFPKSVTFGATQQGQEDVKRAIFADRANLIGRMWTVKFQGRYEDGAPRFPVGIGARDEDLQGAGRTVDAAALDAAKTRQATRFEDQQVTLDLLIDGED